MKSEISNLKSESLCRLPCQTLVLGLVIPAQAGIQIVALDSRLRGNDGQPDNALQRWSPLDDADQHDRDCNQQQQMNESAERG